MFALGNFILSNISVVFFLFGTIWQKFNIDAKNESNADLVCEKKKIQGDRTYLFPH